MSSWHHPISLSLLVVCCPPTHVNLLRAGCFFLHPSFSHFLSSLNAISSAASFSFTLQRPSLLADAPQTLQPLISATGRRCDQAGPKHLHIRVKHHHHSPAPLEKGIFSAQNPRMEDRGAVLSTLCAPRAQQHPESLRCVERPRVLPASCCLQSCL